MKKLTVNVFSTTGISLALLSVIALYYQAECLYIASVFQVLGANFVVHIGLQLLHRLEMKYPVLESALDILIVTGTLAAFGAVFNWFASTPMWILVIMGVVIYIISLLLNLLSMQQDARNINALIQKRNKRNELGDDPAVQR